MKNLMRFFVVCMLLSATAFAGNYTWTGTTSSSWSVSTNWSPNGVPGTSDSIIINTTTTSLVLTGKKTVKRLTMTNDTLNLGGDTLEITGTAGFNGGLITNGVCYPQATGLLSFAGTTFGAEVKAKGQIKLNGSTFNSTAYFEHIGSAAGTGTGGNTFNGPTTLKNTGTSVFKIASTYNDTFNDDVIIANAGASGAAAIQISGGANCYFNGNMTISATTVSGLTFGVLNGATYLASGKTINIGSAGLVGTLLLKNFTQYGNTAQTLSFSGVFNMVNSTFNGNLTVTATNNLLSTSSFHGQCSFTKTGSSTDIAAGGNHFYENVTFTNNATNTAAMRMASTNGDIFEKDITCNTTTGYIQLAYADTTDIYGSISINNTKANFNSGTGYTRFVGGTSQTLNGSANYSFGKLLMNKTSSGITCNKSVTIDSLLNLTSGILYTDTINYLTIKNGVVVSGGSSASYIDGPVKKIGNTAFEFPVGKNGRYMKFGISSTSNPANQFIAEYFDQGQLLGDSVTGGITGICSNEYWKLTGGVSGQTYTVSLSWDMSSRNLQSNSNKVVSAWNGASWINKGTSSINGSSLNGSIMSSTSGNENYFTIAGIGNVMNLDSISISGNFEEFGILCGGNISSVDTVLVFGSIGAYGTVGSKVLGDSVFQLNHAKYTAAISDFYSVLEQVNTLSYDSTLILNNDFHLITAGKYLITGADTLDGELFLDGDSTDKFILICNQDVYLSYKFIIRHKDVRPKNIIFILTSNSTLAEGFNYRGILFGQNFNIDNLLGGRCQLISPSGLNIENTSNNLFGVLSSYTRISMLLPYTCTSQATICNLIKNSGFENGVMPLGTNGITDYYCDCWSAESFADNTCTIGNQNTPDYLDVNGAVSGPVPCQNLPGWTGIPINHVGSSTNVRTVGSENHIHVLDGEEAEGEIDGNFEILPYVLSIWHSNTDCGNNLTNGGFCVSALLPFGGPKGSEQLATIPFSNTNYLPGVWKQSVGILSTNLLSNPTLYNRIGITADFPDPIVKGVYIDDVELVKLYDKPQPTSLACGTQLYGIDLNSPCIAPYIQGPNPLVSFTTNWSSSPTYTGPGFNGFGQSYDNSPIVNPTVPTVFTLELMVNGTQNTTLFFYTYDFTVNPNNGSLSCPITANPSGFCSGQTGNVTLTSIPSGGIIPYTYLWNTNATTSSISVSSAGTYTVTVTDNAGCSGNSTITVNNYPQVQATLTASPANQICANGGAVTLLADNVTGDGPFTYTWSASASTSNSIQVTSSGTYTVTITDSHGCTAQYSQVIGVYPQVGLNITSSTGSFTYCSGSTPITLTANPSNGTSPYNFQWNGGSTNSSIQALNNGTYSATVTDANGCTASASVTVADSQLSLSLSASPAAICEGSSSTITASVSNGSAPYSFQWNNGSTSSTLVVNTNGTYTVTVTDANNCTISSFINITKANNPPPATIIGTTSACENGGVNLLYTISNPNPGYTYTWSSIAAPFGWNIQSPLTIVTTNLITSAPPGTSAAITYPVFSGTASNYILQVITTNTYGCTSSSLFPVNGCICLEPEADYSWSNTSSSSTGALPPNSTLVIHGKYTVNTLGVVWSGANVVMDAGSEIYISPWSSLKLENSTIQPCSVFWKGITVDEGFIEVDNSKIIGAQYAIDIKGNGGYKISKGSELTDNYISLQATQLSYFARIFNNTTINNNQFASYVDFNGQSPRTCTGANDIPYCGINLRNAGVILIGANNYNMETTIDDVSIGIKSENTNLRVVNTNINDLGVLPCNPGDLERQIGIISFGAGYNAEIGGPGLQKCSIDGCRIGVKSNDAQLEFNESRIADCSKIGVLLVDPPTSFPQFKCVVNNNEIFAAQFGVWLEVKHNVNHHTAIDGNKIKAIPGNYVFGGGINNTDLYFPLKGCSFSNNEIEMDYSYKHGIRVLGNNWFGAAGNRITNKVGSGTTAVNGITLNSVMDYNVSLNTIEETNLNTNSNGIRLVNSALDDFEINTMSCNVINNFQRDFYLINSNTDIDWASNYMNDGGVGLRLENASLQRGEPWNWWCGNFTNWWINSVGLTSFANWSQNANINGGCVSQPSFAQINGPNISFSSGTLSNDPGCWGTSYTPPLVNDGDRFVADSANWSSTEASTRWQFRRYLADKILANPNMLEEDSIIINFWNNNQELDEVQLAYLFEHFGQVDTVASFYWSEIETIENDLDSALDLSYYNDSLLNSGLSTNDSIAVALETEAIKTFVYDKQNEKLALLEDINILDSARKTELTDLYSSFQPATELGSIEKQIMLLIIKYSLGVQTDLTVDDSLAMSNYASLCLSEYGHAVGYIRSLYESLTDTLIDDVSGCGGGARIVQPAKAGPVVQDEFRLIPNPARNSVLIVKKSAVASKFDLKLLTLEGRLVLSSSFESDQLLLNVEPLAKGIYFLMFESNDKRYVKKLILE